MGGRYEKEKTNGSLDRWVDAGEPKRKEYTPPEKKPMKMEEIMDRFKSLYGGLPVHVQDEFCEIMFESKEVAGNMVNDAHSWSETLERGEYSTIVSFIRDTVYGGGTKLAGDFVEASKNLLEKTYRSVYDFDFQKKESEMTAEEYVEVARSVAENSPGYAACGDTETFFRSLDLPQKQIETLVRAHKGKYVV